MASAQSGVAGHVFISYVREDSDRVDELQLALQEAGIHVWRDTADLWPGEDWRIKVRRAITDGALVFIACFSRASLARGKSYQNEELTLAIEQLRLRPPDHPWLIPVRFDECEIPDRDIGGGRTITTIHHADLFGQRADDNTARLVASVRRILGNAEPASQTVDASARRSPGAPPGELERLADVAAYHAVSLIGTQPDTAVAIALAAVTELTRTPPACAALCSAVLSKRRSEYRTISSIFDMAFLTNGALAAIADDDSATYSYWPELGGGGYPFHGGNGMKAEGLAAAPDGRVATGFSGGEVCIFQPDRRESRVFSVQDSHVGALAFSRSGLLATCSARTVRIWSQDGELVREIQKEVLVGFDSSDRMATIHKEYLDDGVQSLVRIWMADGKLSHEIEVPGDLVAYGVDGSVASHRAGGIDVFTQDGQLRFRLDHQYPIKYMAFNDDCHLAAADTAGRIIIWNPDGVMIYQLAGHHPDVISLAFAPDGKVAASSGDCTISVWPAPQPVEELIASARSLKLPSLSPEQRRISMLPIG